LAHLFGLVSPQATSRRTAPGRRFSLSACTRVSRRTFSRCGPPSEFPLTSAYSSIVHHLTGPTLIAHTQTSFKRKKSVDSAKQKNPICYFHSAYRFATRTLAIEVDSLVRVTRRVEKNHLAIVVDQHYYTSSSIGETHFRSPQNLQPAYDALNTNRIPVSG